MTDHAGTILMVMSNRQNLDIMSEFIVRLGYTPMKVDSLNQFKPTLDLKQQLLLALIDLTGFDKSVWDFCSRLHEMNVPMLVIAPKYNSSFETESIGRGASGLLIKPLVMRELSALIQKMLSRK